MRDRHHHHHYHHYHGAADDHGGYARHAGEPGPGPNRHRLYRNVRAGKISGVCAGVADYFGWNVKYTRLAAILLTIFFFPAPIVVYAGLAVVLRPGEPIAARYDDPQEERFWRTYSVKPRATLGGLKHRFRAIEARIADMERTVTSSEYSLNRQFRDLERGA